MIMNSAPIRKVSGGGGTVISIDFHMRNDSRTTVGVFYTTIKENKMTLGYVYCNAGYTDQELQIVEDTPLIITANTEGSWSVNGTSYTKTSSTAHLRSSTKTMMGLGIEGLQTGDLSVSYYN